MEKFKSKLYGNKEKEMENIFNFTKIKILKHNRNGLTDKNKENILNFIKVEKFKRV